MNLFPKNITLDLINNSIYGKPNRSYLQEFNSVLDKLSISEDAEIEALYWSVKHLDEVLQIMQPIKSEAYEAFWDIKFQVHEIGKKEENEKYSKSNEATKWIKYQILQNLTSILHRFVMAYTHFPYKTAMNLEKEISLELKSVALEIFHDIFVHFEGLAQTFAEEHDFLLSLFSHLQYLETCFPSCRVLECLLLSRKKLLDLSTIDHLIEMIMGFDDVALGNFCKILAVTLSELDMYEHKTSLYAQTKQKKNQNFYVRDINQDIVLKVPNILYRLVNIACAKPYVPWFPSANVESEQWLKWIEEQCIEEQRRPTSQFAGGITVWYKTGRFGPTMSSIKIASELTFRADAVCVLGLLLAGRHRKEVQKELADLQLIPRLSDLFDHFIWRSNSRRDHTRLPGHNSSCECSPEVALKIQVLRLIHSFCDHSDFKHVMLSWNEYSEIMALEDSNSSTSPHSSHPVPRWLSRRSLCIGEKGFLSKIVEVMKKESGASTFRFWLSRAIESYLRGSFSGSDQDFLLRRNLLQHVVQNLITSNRHKEVLQSSFDLLGELIRFNSKAFHELNNQLRSPAKQRKLLFLMNSSLVDSNMFIRSLILSYEHFITSDDVDLKAFAEKHCFMLSHVGSLKVRVYYLQKLLALINIHNLTQENVSCLNTALVILMFGLQKAELPHYLQVLSSSQESCSFASSSQSGLMDNLRDLLIFWQDHYLQKDKDCSILERSSRIRFQEWRNTVNLLTSDDSQNPNVIAFYKVPHVSSRAS